MKVEAFVEVLTAYADVVAAHGGRQLATQMHNLRKAWSPAMSWSMKRLLGRSKPHSVLPLAADNSVQEFRESLLRLESVVRTVAKQEFLNDLSLLIEALQPHDREDLAAFVTACQAALEGGETSKPKRTQRRQPNEQTNDAPASDYVHRLEHSYKDPERFIPIYEALAGR